MEDRDIKWIEVSHMSSGVLPGGDEVVGFQVTFQFAGLDPDSDLGPLLTVTTAVDASRELPLSAIEAAAIEKAMQVVRRVAKEDEFTIAARRLAARAEDAKTKEQRDQELRDSIAAKREPQRQN